MSLGEKREGKGNFLIFIPSQSISFEGKLNESYGKIVRHGRHNIDN